MWWKKIGNLVAWSTYGDRKDLDEVWLVRTAGAWALWKLERGYWQEEQGKHSPVSKQSKGTRQRRKNLHHSVLRYFLLSSLREFSLQANDINRLSRLGIQPTVPCIFVGKHSKYKISVYTYRDIYICSYINTHLLYTGTKYLWKDTQGTDDNGYLKAKRTKGWDRSQRETTP